MPDPASIPAAFASVKSAIEIAKLIKDSGASLEKAEVKLRLADLVSTLADARMELAEVQEAMASKDARIRELESAFQTKSALKRVGDAMYACDDSGTPTGQAFCIGC
jgi:hypothetical protein